VTITEFLLARLAEDEAGALISPREWWSERLLDECEAKRAIVDECTAASEWAASPDCDAPLSYSTLAGALLGALRHLATIYADHPDYDEAWRP